MNYDYIALFRQSVKHNLDTLKPKVDEMETDRKTIIKNITPAEVEQVRRVMDKLREEWAQVIIFSF